MEITIDETKIDGVLHKAILEAIGKDGQALIIKQVVDHLITKQGGGYKKDKSPLQIAVNEAAERVAKTVVQDKLEKDPEFISNIDKLLTDAIKRFFEMENREEILKKMVSKMGEAFSKYDW